MDRKKRIVFTYLIFYLYTLILNAVYLWTAYEFMCGFIRRMNEACCDVIIICILYSIACAARHCRRIVAPQICYEASFV